MTDKQERMKELHKILKASAKAYYAGDEEIISNFEYDRLYDELVALEEETGIVLAGSPTMEVGYEAVDELPKERHASPMLSLSKTKDREELREWLGDKAGLLSWKLDGLTIVLTYEGGELVKAVTRGNGEIGEVVTANAKCFVNIPLKISYTGTMVIRGEAVIGYEDFEAINKQIANPAEQYKNPRNLCSGSVRQLNSAVTADRHVRFFPFALVSAEGVDFGNSRLKQMEYLQNLGFEPVRNIPVSRENILDVIKEYERDIATYDIPSDGLVLLYDDIEYGRSLGRTAKAPRDAIAFKWQDETMETTLKYIEWSPSRTGLINPVAVFEPVELEGTTVSRASVHNVSVMRALKLGVGDKILVYKANMIIPQIAENLTKSDSVDVPDKCPVCGGQTEIMSTNGASVLMCVSKECPVKRQKSLVLFASRNAMNIEGISEETIEKFVSAGFIKEYADFYKLDRFKEEIVGMEGFGEKSYNNIIESVEKSRNTQLPRVIYALGIDNIGVAGAKLIAKHFDYDFDKCRAAGLEELSEIDGVGEVIANGYVRYMNNPERMREMDNLMAEVSIEINASEAVEETLKGLTFVITGSLEHFNNRDELKEIIESKGGKVAGSVSKNTNALINNDVTSASSKNKKAKELGVAILSENDFLEQYNIEGTI